MSEPVPEKPPTTTTAPKSPPPEQDAAALQKAADEGVTQGDQQDETQPGGKYVVDGVWVDAEGRPLADKKE